MASIRGFELKEIKRFQNKDGYPLQQAMIYLRNEKVGVITENEKDGLPAIQINQNSLADWKEAIEYFKENFYDSKEIATEEELYYFLLTLKEWEKILKQKLQNGVALVVVLEEMDKRYGYRTGGYKIYTLKSEEEAENLIDDAQRYSTEKEPVWWKKLHFGSLDELNFG